MALQRSFEELAIRMRARRVLSTQEFDFLGDTARSRGDLATWMMLRAGENEVDLADAVASELTGEKPEAIVRGAAQLGGFLRHSAWHVLAWLVEKHPATLGAIEAAIADWPAHERPWLRTWLASAELGETRPFFRLPQNLGLAGEPIDGARLHRLLPALFALRELDLRSSRIAAAELRTLAASPSLARLEFISLARAGIDDEACAVLADNVSWPALTRLELSGNRLTARGLARLIRSPGLPSIRAIDVAACDVKLSELAQELEGGQSRARPVMLDVSQCPGVSEGLIALSRSPALRWVAGLEIHHVPLTPEAAQALAKSPFALSLRNISVNEESLGKSGVRALLEAPWIGNLEHLNLFGQRPGDGIGPALSRLGGGAIQHLELMHARLGPASSRALASADFSRLRVLHLSHNPIGDAGLAAILANPSLTSLEVFEAMGCGADLQTARAAARATHLGRLRVLALGDQVPGTAVRAFAGANLPGLRLLKLGDAPTAELAALDDDPKLARALITNAHFTSAESLA